MTMLHFSRSEFLTRQHAACSSMLRKGLDGLIIFRQESMYYLTGYDTSGYTMFQAMFLGADGRFALLTRPIDLIQARATSIIEDIQIWYDHNDAMPEVELRSLLQEYGASGKLIGIEYHAYGLTGQRANRVIAALDGFCDLIDASDLISQLRLVKSPAELDYVRKAGALCDQIIKVSLDRCRPGASTKAIYGDMMQALMTNGGDPPAGRWPIGAGQSALFGRYHTGDSIIGEDDQVVFEPAAAYRHYHVCAMYNVITGSASVEQADMNKACVEALDTCQESLRPGRTVGEVFDLHRRVFEAAGFGHAAMSACGYTMGAIYPPTWMDWPMFWADNPQIIQAGMVFFLHMILFDRHTGVSMCIGETAIIKEDACERVSHIPRRIIEVA